MGQESNADGAGRPFSLVRWFGVVSALAIVAIAVVSGWFLQHFVTENTLARDAETMMLFTNSIVRDEQAESYFLSDGHGRAVVGVNEFFTHLGRMPGVLRANAYATDRTVIWSSNPRLTGRQSRDNKELERAFLGEPVARSGRTGRNQKTEHRGLAPPGTFFVENYLPIWASAGSRRVIGVVEVYRTPERLEASIERGQRLIVIGDTYAGIKGRRDLARPKGEIFGSGFDDFPSASPSFPL